MAQDTRVIIHGRAAGGRPLSRAARLALVVLLAAPALHCARDADALFDESELHRLDITISPRDWETLRARYAGNDYYRCEVAWNGRRAQNVGMRSRGSGSRSGDKPGLRLDFDHHDEAGRFLGLEALVLDNLTTDPSMVRERAAMAFFRRFGVPAPREVHAEIFVNNQFAGLYAIVEPIDETFVNTHLDRGGTLFEYRWISRWNGDYLGEDPALYQPLFELHTETGASLEELYEPIRRLFWSVRWAPDYRATVGALLDFDSTLRLIAAETLLAEWDGLLGYSGMNNFYLYRAPRTGRHHVLPWDKDNTFRRWDYPIMTGATDNAIMRRVLAEPTLRARYFALLIEAAEAASEQEWLAREIRFQHEQIGEAARADEFKPFTNEQFEEQIDTLMEFAEKRSAFVIEQARQEQAGR
jgi:spore coat protein CotH